MVRLKWFIPVLVLVAACGSPTQQTSTNASSASAASPAPASSAAPSAANQSPAYLTVVVDPASSRYQLSTGTTLVRFMREDGSEAARQTLRSGVRVLAAAGARVFLVEQGGILKALHMDGTVEELGRLGGEHADQDSFVVSPDGSRWLWSACCPVPRSVHMGGVGISDRVVERSSDQTHWLQPYAWNDAGAIIAHPGMGIGGYILYISPFGSVDQLDASSGAVSPMNLKSDCAFSDLAANGAIACIHRGRTARDLSVKVVQSNGSVITLPVPAGDQQAGQALFSPDGLKLAFGSSPQLGSFASSAGSYEQYHLRLASSQGGSTRAFGPSNTKPDFWLPDGALVVSRPDNAQGGSAATYAVRPDGNHVQLSSTNGAVGFVTSS